MVFKYVCVELSFNVESMATAKKQQKKLLSVSHFKSSPLSSCILLSMLAMLLVYNGEGGDGWIFSDTRQQNDIFWIIVIWDL